MNGHSLLLHTASHLFAKSVSCHSANFTTRDFECMVHLKKFTLQQNYEGAKGDWVFRISDLVKNPNGPNI